MPVDLRLGDVRNLIRTVPDGSIDCIVTDPPYPVISGGNKNPNAPKGILTANDGKIFQHNDIKIDEYADELFRVARDPSHIYVFTNVMNMWSVRERMLQSGFHLHNVLIWRKMNATPNRWYMRNCEYVLFFRKGKAFPINHKGSKTCISTPSVSNRQHPTEKPTDLLREFIINSTRPGETVFDPFFGCGSTAVAARATNRNFIGFEIDADYFFKTTIRLSGVSNAP